MTRVTQVYIRRNVKFYFEPKISKYFRFKLIRNPKLYFEKFQNFTEIPKKS